MGLIKIREEITSVENPEVVPQLYHCN